MFLEPTSTTATTTEAAKASFGEGLVWHTANDDVMCRVLAVNGAGCAMLPHKSIV